MVKPFENDEYYLKMRNKILKRLAISNDNLLKEVKDLKDSFELVRKNDSVIYYNKIMEYYLFNVYDFFYKFGQIFLFDKELLQYYSEVLKTVTADFVKKINEDLKNCITTFFKNYPVNLDSCKEYFTQIEPFVVMYRAVRFSNDKQYIISFKFDSPVKVKFSEITYKSISNMLSTFPKPDLISQNLPINEKDFKAYYYFCALERDLRIFQYFGVKMEEYSYGSLLYDN